MPQDLPSSQGGLRWVAGLAAHSEETDHAAFSCVDQIDATSPLCTEGAPCCAEALSIRLTSKYTEATFGWDAGFHSQVK